MSVESPPRLKDGAELGAIIRAGAADDLSAERLAAGGIALRAAVAGGAAASGVAAWKIALPLIALIGLVVVSQRGDGADDARGAAPVVAAVAHDAAPVTADAVTAAAAIVAAPVAAPVADPALKTKRVRGEPTAPEVAPVPATSDLPEQIRLYEEARAAGARGDFAFGLDRLAELTRRFPATPLRADADLTRAELLTRANQLDDAVAALAALAADPVHAGRKGELYRTLGDVHRKRGDCPSAIEAYGQARAAGLGAVERTKVDRGLARCAPPK